MNCFATESWELQRNDMGCAKCFESIDDHSWICSGKISLRDEKALLAWFYLGTRHLSQCLRIWQQSARATWASFESSEAIAAISSCFSGSLHRMTPWAMAQNVWWSGTLIVRGYMYSHILLCSPNTPQDSIDWAFSNPSQQKIEIWQPPWGHTQRCQEQAFWRGCSCLRCKHWHEARFAVNHWHAMLVKVYAQPCRVSISPGEGL